MSIAVFGTKTFSVSSSKVITFDDLSLSGELQVDTQEVDKQKPSTYIKGPGLEKISFIVSLKASLGVDVRAEIDSWRAIRDAGIPQVFSIGGKPISKNKWLLISAEVSEASINAAGQFVSAKLNLSFEEFVRFGKKEDQKSGGGAAKSKTKSPKSIDYYRDRDSKKRSNPNANKAVADGPLLVSPKI